MGPGRSDRTGDRLPVVRRAQTNKRKVAQPMNDDLLAILTPA
jgi:hypothetical protein